VEDADEWHGPSGRAECLLRKHEALSSNPNTTKNLKNKGKKERKKRCHLEVESNSC
jgi:hypothetical protein